MNKLLRIWLLLIAFSPIFLVKGQMVTRKLNTTYGLKDVPVYKVIENGKDKFYLRNVPPTASKSNTLPTLNTFYTPQITEAGNDYRYTIVDSTGKGLGSYDVVDAQGKTLMEGKEAISAYWLAGEVLKYYRNLYKSFGTKYVGVSNKSTEVLSIVIAGEAFYSSLSSARSFIIDETLGIYDIEFTQSKKNYTPNIMGHEIGHQIMNQNGLEFGVAICDMGYIHESIADAFGLLAKNYVLKKESQTPASYVYDWNFMRGNNTSVYDAGNPQSMKAWGKPTAYQGVNYDQLCQEEHNNRTLVPYWLYLLSQGGSGYVDEDELKSPFVVTGIGVDKAERILFQSITQFLPAYSTNMTWANFRKAAEEAAISLYGAKSAEFYAVQDACAAIGIGLSSSQLLGSVPSDNAIDVNPWPVTLSRTIQYPGFEQGWELDISTDKTFKDQLQTRTIPNITQSNPSDLSISVTANLQPHTLYYWRVRTTVFGNCSYSPAICSGLQFQLSLGLDVRSFITDSRIVTALDAKNYYPWGVPLQWQTLLIGGSSSNKDLSPVEEYQLSIYDADDAADKPFIKNKIYYPVSAPVQSIATTKPDYVVLRPNSYYGFTVRAKGPNDIFGRPSFGLESKRVHFITDRPTTKLLTPKNGAVINIFSSPSLPSMSWEPTLNAKEYLVEWSKDPAMPHPDHVTTSFKFHPFHPGSSQDGNNKYYWQVTPVSPDLTLDVPAVPANPAEVILGKASSKWNFTYDYAATRPLLTNIESVRYLQYQVKFGFKAPPIASSLPSGSVYYVIRHAKQGFLSKPFNVTTHGFVDIIQDNGSGTYETVRDGSLTYPFSDLAASSLGYEWEVQAYRKVPGGTDIAGEAVRSAYRVQPAQIIIAEPGVGAVHDPAQALSVNFITEYAPGGVEYRLGLTKQANTNPAIPGTEEVVNLVTTPQQPLLFTLESKYSDHYYVDPSQLAYNTTYYLQITGLDLPGSSLRGYPEIREFKTGHNPPGTNPAPSANDVPFKFTIQNNSWAFLTLKLVNMDDQSEVNLFDIVDENGVVIDHQKPAIVEPFNNDATNPNANMDKWTIKGFIQPGNWQLKMKITNPLASQNPNFNITVHDDEYPNNNLNGNLLADLKVDSSNYLVNYVFGVPFYLAPAP